MSNAVTLTFAGDTKSLDSATARANKDLGSLSNSLDRNADHAKKAGHQIDAIGENLDGSTKKFRGGKDVVDGMSDSLGALGVTLPGPIGNIAMMAGGLADLADGIATTVLPMLQKLWLVIMANPFVAIAALVVALGVGLYELYKHSDRFRKAVDALWSTVKKAFNAIKGVMVDVFDWVKGHWPLLLAILGGPLGAAAVLIIKNFGKIKSAAKAVWDYLKKGFGAVGSVISGMAEGIKNIWNSTLGGRGISVHTPGSSKFHIPSFGFDMKIPMLANGGAINGPSIVGERGPELFVPSGAGRIVSNAQMGQGGGGTTVIQFMVDGKLITESVYTGLLKKKRRTGNLGLA